MPPPLQQPTWPSCAKVSSLRRSCCSVTQLCLTLCNPIDSSTPGFPVLHYLPELAQLMSIESLMPSNHLILCHPLSYCPQCFPALGSFPMNWLFASGGQSIETSASASFLPEKSQGWSPSEWAGWISLQSKGLLKSLLQHHSSKASILQCSAFFTLQCSHPYMNTGKTIALTIQIFVSKAMSLLSRFVKIPPYRSDYKLSEAHWNLAQRLGQNWKHRVLQVWDKEFWSYLNLGLNPGSTIYKLY